VKEIPKYYQMIIPWVRDIKLETKRKHDSYLTDETG